jgi:small subunit ribosomal protein S8
MLSHDPIADMLTRIRNAISVRKSEVSLPHSKIKESVAKLLKDNNFIDSVSTSGKGIDKSLEITINSPATSARITNIERLSRPGKRHYVKAGTIPTVKNGRGIVIVSTSKGLMSGQKAKNEKLGGELICKVY